MMGVGRVNLAEKKAWMRKKGSSAWYQIIRNQTTTVDDTNMLDNHLSI